jgi:hypothetical protein
MRYLDSSQRDIGRTGVGFVSDEQNGTTEDWRSSSCADNLGSGARSVVIATAVWSVFELPFELWVSRTLTEAAACIVAKVLWVALVGMVLTGNRTARFVYAFLCTIGLMVMAFGLPGEYRMFPPGFILSSIECVLKATAFVCMMSSGIYADDEPVSDDMVRCRE